MSASSHTVLPATWSRDCDMLFAIARRMPRNGSTVPSAGPAAAIARAAGEGDEPFEGNAPLEGDVPLEGDAPLEGDVPLEGDAPLEEDAPFVADAPFAAAGMLACRRTSSSVINPARPPPWTVARSTPKLFASARAAGTASARCDFRSEEHTS